MWIHDITSLIQVWSKSYVFNPSVIHLEDNLFLVVYRVYAYRYPDIEGSHNPWKTWDNGYKFFSDPGKVMRIKYRDARLFDGSFDLVLTRDEAPDMPAQDEYDSTALAVIELDSAQNAPPRVVYNVARVFSRMNQDARVWRLGDQMYISYNVFCDNGRVCLLQRTLDVDLVRAVCHFGAEQTMFDHIYQEVEKNCVPNQCARRGGASVMYALGRTFDTITEKKLFRRTPCPLARLIDFYGKDQIVCSVSTPAIPYGKRWLSCGHIKVCYKKIQNGTLKAFIDRFSFKPAGAIYPHGKYIYFAYLFEFDKDYNITRYSHLFIPSLFGEHVPYLLVMPMGLCAAGDKIMLSYGEGDRKCKLLLLSRAETERLLDRDFDGSSEMGAYLLSQAAHIQHIGYFGFKNAGDDAFRRVFEHLQAKYYPHARVEFVPPPAEKARPNLTILGGGDVINPFFMEGLEERSNKIAVGVGVPYQEFERYVASFDFVVTRSEGDVDALRRFNDRVEYFPDLCFLLPAVYPARPAARRGIGVSVLRTYFHPDYPDLWVEYVAATAAWIEQVRAATGEEVVLLPFGYDEENPRENDLVTCRDIAARVPAVRVLDPRAARDPVACLLDAVRGLSFVVCARLHSHIFSAAAGVPFVSLTCGKKCIDFMTQTGLEDCMFSLEKNQEDLPVHWDACAIAAFVLDRWERRGELEKRVSEVAARAARQMDAFEERYLEILRRATREGPLVLL